MGQSFGYAIHFKNPFRDYDFEFTKKELQIEDNELCYVISNCDDIDGQVIGFAEAFEKVYGRGFGSLIIDSSGDKLSGDRIDTRKTEQVYRN